MKTNKNQRIVNLNDDNLDIIKKSNHTHIIVYWGNRKIYDSKKANQ